MKIKVILRSDGSEVEIDHTELDDKLHRAVGAETPKRVADMTSEEFADVQARATAAALAGVLDGLQRTGEGGDHVDRSRLSAGGAGGDTNTRDKGVDIPMYTRDNVSYGSALRAIPGWEAQYRTLPESERAIRTPEGDVNTWRHMKALVEKDSATLLTIRDADPILRLLKGKHRDNEYVARALGGATAAAGGSMVPTPLSDLIVLKRDARERIAPRAMSLTSTALTLTIVQENAVGAVTGTAENADLTETDSTFSEIILSKKKAGRLVRSSKELLDDISAAFSLSTILSNQAARKLSVYMEAQSAQTGDGTGVNHKLAIAQATIATVAGVTGALTRPMLVDMQLALPSEYRDGGGLTWMGNAAVTAILAKLVDGNNRPLYSPADAAVTTLNDAAGAANVVEGYPYIELPITADNIYIGLLSEGFAVIKDGGIRVEVTTEADDVFKKDQVQWKFVERRDSGVINTAAFRKSVGTIS